MYVCVVDRSTSYDFRIVITQYGGPNNFKRTRGPPVPRTCELPYTTHTPNLSVWSETVHWVVTYRPPVPPLPPSP